MTELEALRLQLAEARTLIEASRKQEPVAWKYTHIQSGYTDVSLNYPEKISELDVLEIEPLFAAPVAAPVVAPDVLKDAERYRWLREYLPSDDMSVDDDFVAALNPQEIDAVIDAAMGSAND